MKESEKAIAIVKGKMKVCAGYLPGYKKPCLYVYESATMCTKVATFCDHKSAVMFMDYLAEMMGAKEK